MSHPVPETADRDRAAAAAVRHHHAQLADELDQRTETLLGLVESQYLLKAEQARQNLLAYLRRDLVPHALAEEQALYPAAAGRPDGKLLVEGMLGEHRAITALVDEVDRAGSLIRAASAGRALAALFATHLAKENDLILPLLVDAPEVSLGDLLAGMHELLGADGHGAHGHGAAAADQGCGCGGCGCGDDQVVAGPAAGQLISLDALIDVRRVPHSERHRLVLSTVESLQPGQAVVLVADHAPRPLLAQIDALFPAQIAAEWLETGPEVFQLRLERVAVPVRPAPSDTATPGAAASAEQGGGCGCGHDDQATGATPVEPVDADVNVDANAVVDVRRVPHSERHRLVLSTAKSLQPGQTMVLVANHAPRPVLAEVDALLPGQIVAEWLETGPEVWQIRLERVAVAG